MASTKYSPFSPEKTLVFIQTYNRPHVIGLVEELMGLGFHVMIVDDASPQVLSFSGIDLTRFNMFRATENFGKENRWKLLNDTWAIAQSIVERRDLKFFFFLEDDMVTQKDWTVGLASLIEEIQFNLQDSRWVLSVMRRLNYNPYSWIPVTPSQRDHYQPLLMSDHLMKLWWLPFCGWITPVELMYELGWLTPEAVATRDASGIEKVTSTRLFNAQVPIFSPVHGKALFDHDDEHNSVMHPHLRPPPA